MGVLCIHIRSEYFGRMGRGCAVHPFGTAEIMLLNFQVGCVTKRWCGSIIQRYRQRFQSGMGCLLWPSSRRAMDGSKWSCRDTINMILIEQ